ncbi:MAG TPA: hypothetical protein VJT82_02835, partial [Pyrinomonadaceae bacterium]|nr:hypothetical protein [Pyrinomonadaceae bacterium]
MSSVISEQPAHELSQDAAVLLPAAPEAAKEMAAQAVLGTGLPVPLANLIESLTPESLGETMRRIFTDLAHLLDYLRLIEKKVQQDQLLASTFSVFTHVHKESLALIEFIETSVQRMDDANEGLLS